MIEGIFYATITIIVGLVVAGIAFGIIRWLKKRAEKTATELDDIILLAVGTPLVIWIILVSVYIALTRYGLLPESFAGISSSQIINAVFIVLAAWAVSVFFTNLIRTYGARISEKTDGDLDRIIPIILITVRYVIWFAVFLILLANFCSVEMISTRERKKEFDRKI